MYGISNATLLCNMVCVIIYSFDDQKIYLSDIALHLMDLNERHTRIKETKQSDENEIMIAGNDDQTRTRTLSQNSHLEMHKSLMHSPHGQPSCVL